MKKKWLMLLIFTLAAVTVVGVGQEIASAQQGTGKTSLRTISIDPSKIDPEYIAEPKIKIPVLTEAEKKMAIDIALSDPRVQELIADKAYTICDIGVAHTTDLVKIGAAVNICFDQTYELEYDWPFVYSSEEGKLIEDYTRHEELPVQSLEVFVNFQRGDVVEQISPIPPLGEE